MVGLVGSRFHWAFDRARLCPEAGAGHCVALVLSASREEVKWLRSELIAQAETAMREYFPKVATAQLIRSQVSREPFATVSLAPGSLCRRLPLVTEVANLFLAGDWTRTGIPATIEGAIRSGYAAAAAVRELPPLTNAQ